MKVKELRQRLKVFKNQYGDKMEVRLSFTDMTGARFNLPCDRIIVERLWGESDPQLTLNVDIPVNVK